MPPPYSPTALSEPAKEWVYEVKNVGFGLRQNTWEQRASISQSLFNEFAEGHRQYKNKGIAPSLAEINAIPITDPGFILKDVRLAEMTQAGLDVTIVSTDTATTNSAKKTNPTEGEVALANLNRRSFFLSHSPFLDLIFLNWILARSRALPAQFWSR
jgi:hypothetical protein